MTRCLALGLALATGVGPSVALAAGPGSGAPAAGSASNAPKAPKLELSKLLSPMGGGTTADGSAPSKLRMLLGFAVTTGLKYAMGGLGPARFLPYLSALTPAVAVPTLIGLSLAESAASIYVFNLIAGIENHDRQVVAFLLAGASSALLTPLLTGVLGPLGATLVTNAARLLLFNLIARKGDAEPVEPVALAKSRDLAGKDPAIAKATPAPDPEGMSFRASIVGDLATLKQRVDLAYQAVIDEGKVVSRGSWNRYVQAKNALDLALESALAR